MTAGGRNTTLRLEGPHNFGRKLHRRCTAKNDVYIYIYIFFFKQLAGFDLGLTLGARADMVLSVRTMAE